jgi:hypothetical protein
MHAFGHLARQRLLGRSFFGLSNQRSFECFDFFMSEECEPTQVRDGIAIIDVDPELIEPVRARLPFVEPN